MKTKKEYEAILVIALGFTLLYFWLDWEYLLYLAGVVLIPGFSSKWVRVHIVRSWFGLARVLGAINSRILLALVYYLLLTPLAWMKKLFARKDTNNHGSSYFVERNHTYTPDDFDNPW